jgi:hypothetical protein
MGGYRVSPFLDCKIGILPGIDSGFDLGNYFFSWDDLFALQMAAATDNG